MSSGRIANSLGKASASRFAGAADNFPSFSTDFAGYPDGESIGIIPGITQIDGSATHMIINEALTAARCNTTDPDGTFFRLPNTGSLAQYIEGTFTAIAAGGSGLCLRGSSRTSAIAIRCSTTAWTVALRDGGAWGVVNNGTYSAVAPQAGDTARMECNLAGDIRVWINGVLRITTDPGVASVLTSTYPGIVARSTIQNFVSNVASGHL